MHQIPKNRSISLKNHAAAIFDLGKNFFL
jgi:hypothetical protein